MTVRELIRELSQLDPDLPVVVISVGRLYSALTAKEMTSVLATQVPMVMER